MTLYLVRDHIGEKPLYYGWQNDTFFFASELKATQRYPDFRGDIDRDALALYFRYNYIPAPYSIYRGVHKLEPGTILQFSIDTASQGGIRTDPKEVKYWSLKDIVECSGRHEYDGTAHEAASPSTLQSFLLPIAATKWLMATGCVCA